MDSINEFVFYNFILFVKYFIEFFIVKNISSVFSNVSIYNDALQVIYQNRLHILRVVFKKVGGKGEIVGKRNCKGRGIFESFSPLTLILNTDCYHHIFIYDKVITSTICFTLFKSRYGYYICPWFF